MSEKKNIYSREPLSVSALTASLRTIIEANFPFVTVSGEISNLARPGSGHLYFSLKDKQTRIRAVMFRTQQRYLDRMPGNGDEIICRGRISVYEARGEYQLIIDTLEHAGSGSLRLAFEALKRRLADEGLFAAEGKKPVPSLPEKITLVTSPSGAAVHDFIRTAQRRFRNIAIEVMPVTVQGEGAANEIGRALLEINGRKESDLIVICRGGGSLEDLAPFNDEVLARAIAASVIPVVSAVGHEIDFTIADLVADLRAPTPTAAAELVVPEKAHLSREVNRRLSRLEEIIKGRIENQYHHLRIMERFLSDPIIAMYGYREMIATRIWQLRDAIKENISSVYAGLERLKTKMTADGPLVKITTARLRCDELDLALKEKMQRRLEKRGDRLAFVLSRLDNVSPLAVLGRGYAIATRRLGGELIEDAATVNNGEEIEVRLKRGGLACRVTEGHKARPER